MLELLRQVKEQCQMQSLAGAAQAVARLRRYQMCQMLAGIDAVATQSTYLLAQLGRVACLANVNEQLTELCHIAVDLHDELQQQVEQEEEEQTQARNTCLTFCGSRVGSSNCGR